MITKKQIEKISRKVLRLVKNKKGLVALIHFGSSLKPKQMMIESDIDYLAITKRKPKERMKFLREEGGGLVEVTIHLYSRRDFLKGLKEGFPLVLMALGFGGFLYGTSFLNPLKERAKPTESTIKTWYENGRRVYALAMMGYFSESCLGCYLKDCHHAARSLLRSYILKHKELLCEGDTLILENTPRELVAYYKKIVECRKKADLPLKLRVGVEPKKILEDRAGKPFSYLEKIFAYVVRDFEGKEVYTLKEVCRGLGKKVFSVSLNSEYFIHLLAKKKKDKFIKRNLYKSLLK